MCEMDIGGLLTSAGINIAICVVLFSLYSVLRKQPSNKIVYFARKIQEGRANNDDPFWFERFVPSPSWLIKAWETTEDEILAIGGVDALAFMRIIIFCIRVFSIAATICLFVVAPVNYYGQEMHHKSFHAESLDVFTIGNVKEESQWLWVHCLALYVITSSACVLLYFEYKSIAKLRLAYISDSAPNPSHFTVLVRGIPWSNTQSYSETVKKFFTDYYASSYLSHQMVYRASKYQKLMSDAEKMCKMIKIVADPQSIQCRTCLVPSFFAGGTTPSFKMLPKESESVSSITNLTAPEQTPSDKIENLESLLQECPAAFVFFKSRFAAVIAAQVLQASNPMLWVTELAPEPHDVYWANLWIPFRQLWIRKLAVLLATIAFMLVFLIPVTFVQGLTQLDHLTQTFPFMRKILKVNFMKQIVTGYLPSVVLMLFLYTVPPLMMLFSKLEGPTSRSWRKNSASIKVLYFMIWNVFFVNVFSGSVISQLGVFNSFKSVPTQLAKAVPTQAAFFMTYVCSSGWASLASELIQLFPFLANMIKKLILRTKNKTIYTFPFHTEIPRLLLLGLLGFTCAVLAPIIVPFLLVFYFLAYLVYKNQIINVYVKRYQGGGQFWPIVHNTIVFSLVLAQIIALGVFGIKRSPIASGFTIPLIILTLLFNEYCRKRFSPVFKRSPVQVLMDMDHQDEASQQLEAIYEQLHSAYCQFPSKCQEMSDSLAGHWSHYGEHGHVKDPESLEAGKKPPEKVKPSENDKPVENGRPSAVSGVSESEGTSGKDVS